VTLSRHTAPIKEPPRILVQCANRSRGNEFSGRVKGVQLAIAEDAESVDHLISPEDAIRIAMARQ
jgi:hypothetical protein